MESNWLFPLGARSYEQPVNQPSLPCLLIWDSSLFVSCPAFAVTASIGDRSGPYIATPSGSMMPAPATLYDPAPSRLVLQQPWPFLPGLSATYRQYYAPVKLGWHKTSSGDSGRYSDLDIVVFIGITPVLYLPLGLPFSSISCLFAQIQTLKANTPLSISLINLEDPAMTPTTRTRKQTQESMASKVWTCCQCSNPNLGSQQECTGLLHFQPVYARACTHWRCPACYDPHRTSLLP